MTYLTALANARLVPVIAAPLRAENAASELLRRVDGLVLTGGADVSPAFYGATPHPKLGTVSEERDSWELALVHAAMRLHIPTLAICRGVQVVNVALGGTLIQDIPSQVPHALNHDPDLPRTGASHAVEIDTNSRVARALGVVTLQTNSVHHQSVDRVADSLRVVGTAPDGVIEAVESAPDSPWWCVGVQWHPEDMLEAPEPWSAAIFHGFAMAVREAHAGRVATP